MEKRRARLIQEQFRSAPGMIRMPYVNPSLVESWSRSGAGWRCCWCSGEMCVIKSYSCKCMIYSAFSLCLVSVLAHSRINFTHLFTIVPVNMCE